MMGRLDHANIPAPELDRIAERVAAIRHEHPGPWQGIEADSRIASSLPLVWYCSEFVASSCHRDPSMLEDLVRSGRMTNPIDAGSLKSHLDSIAQGAVDDIALQAALRRFRRYHMVRIAWRDLAGWADTVATLCELSDLADVCIQFAHDRAYADLVRRHGVPIGAQSGSAQSLVILGMGKLGGRELNYSSDIDLIFLYPEDGETKPQSGDERVVENAEFFLRLGQRVINLLAAKTVDGFVYRVDMRLRPFGDSGRMAISFDSFEDYLQQHGRDWERYAYVKARPIVNVEGDAAHHKSLYENLTRPFVYRRYLDFGVFDSLREMKALIAREVARRELQDNVKLGPGGIREIEFIVQAFQLIRGGSDRRLQTRELGVALPLLAGQKLLPEGAVSDLWAAYLFLRRVENRLQEYNDEQTHRLPADDAGRRRLAVSMAAASWEVLERDIAAQRAIVAKHFANIVFGPADRESSTTPTNDFDLDAIEDVRRRIASSQIRELDACTSQLQSLREGGYYRRLDETGRRRLNLLLPRLLQLLADQPTPDVALTRVLRIVEMIGGRTVYLALLHENGIALQRLVELCARSQFLADQIAAFPLLLDELIDARLLENVPTRAQFASELALRIESSRNEDVDLQIEALRHFQRAAMFRIAVADFSGRLPLMKISDRLTDLAELIVNEALAMAWSHIVARHGVPRCGADQSSLREAHVVVIAYGKFGGIELGYGSDLDLVFLHDSAGEVQMTDGPSPVENTVFFARLGQRLVHLLTTHTRAGRLYEVDIRLRHAIRRESLREEVRSMRQRMRTELSKAKAGQFDLKQDAGGIADLEFLTQYWMLKWCDRYPPIVTFSDNIRQLESLASGAIVPQSTVDFLTETYRKYRQRMHHLSLESGDDVISDSEFAEERAKLIALWKEEMEQRCVGGDE